MVESHLRKEPQLEIVPQFNISIKKSTKELFSALNYKIFSNSVFSKRILISKNDNEYYLNSVPYGYTKNLLQQL